MLVAEGRPDGAGFQTAAALAKAGVPVTVVLDSAVGYHMEVADLCVTGAEGVLENGGIVNKVGWGLCSFSGGFSDKLICFWAVLVKTRRTLCRLRWLLPATAQNKRDCKMGFHSSFKTLN